MGLKSGKGQEFVFIPLKVADRLKDYVKETATFIPSFTYYYEI